jgi:hypothetical protein
MEDSSLNCKPGRVLIENNHLKGALPSNEEVAAITG